MKKSRLRASTEAFTMLIKTSSKRATVSLRRPSQTPLRNFSSKMTSRLKTFILETYLERKFYYHQTWKK